VFAYIILSSIIDSLFCRDALTFIFHVGVPSEEQLTFYCAMSEIEFFKWLKSRGVSEKDCKTLSGTLLQIWVYCIIIICSGGYLVIF
jgi:hypothetical protein